MKYLIRIIGINLVISIFMIGTSFSAWAQKEPYKIGCNLELTGYLSGAVAYIKNGLLLEQERVNAQGGIDGHPLELIIEDNSMDITKAATIQTKFARDKKIKAIIGPFFSQMSAALIPITEREKVPDLFMLGPAARDRQIKTDWVFYVPQADIAVGQRLTDLVMGRGYKKVFAFNSDALVFVDVAKFMKEEGQKHGIEVFITKESYRGSDTDMTPQVIKFKDQLKEYDALYVGGGAESGAIIARNLQEQGIRMPILGPHAFGFGYILQVARDVLEGVQFVAGKACVPYQLDDADPQKPVIEDFDKRMKARWGRPADQLSAHGHDAVWILYHAFKRAGENPMRAKLRDAIEKTKNFVGVTGIINYSPTDHLGVNKKSLVFIKVENNKFVRFKLPQYE